MTSYIFLTSYFFDEHLTPKITVQLILCFLILLVPNFMEIRNIYNSMKPIYRSIDWRKHLIPNHHSWISEYMDTHGVDFYAKTADIINEGWKRNKKQVVIAKFLRTPILISVPKEDYKDALHYCLKWFEHQELYEYC